MHTTPPPNLPLIFGRKYQAKIRETEVISESLKGEAKRFMTTIYTFSPLNIMEVSRTPGLQ